MGNRSKKEKEKRRAAHRVPFEATTKIADLRIVSESQAKIENISLGGAFIRTDSDLKPGTILSLFIQSDQLGGAVIATAKVVWAQPGKGAGVQFLHLTDQARSTIDKLVSHRASLEGKFLID